MSKPTPRYFIVDGRPVKTVTTDERTDVLSMDPNTGAMVPDASVGEHLAGAEVERETYMGLLDQIREPILERYATAPLLWESAVDWDYGLTIDGHQLTIRVGEFPVEPMYLLHIDGQLVYAIDDWPSAWTKPRVIRETPPAR